MSKNSANFDCRGKYSCHHMSTMEIWYRMRAIWARKNSQRRRCWKQFHFAPAARPTMCHKVAWRTRDKELSGDHQIFLLAEFQTRSQECCAQWHNIYIPLFAQRISAISLFLFLLRCHWQWDSPEIESDPADLAADRRRCFLISHSLGCYCCCVSFFGCWRYKNPESQESREWARGRGRWLGGGLFCSHEVSAGHVLYFNFN
jgi:hypothetical protein